MSTRSPFPDRVRRRAALATLGLAALVAAQGVAASPAHAASASTPVFRSHPLSRVPASPGLLSPTTANLGWQAQNWSGYALTGGTGTYAAVTGCWTVPTVSASARDTYSSAWIGIDGDGNTDLIQTGTEQDWYQGSPLYLAWWEILPAAAQPIGYVSPGDQMCASVARGTGGIWTISLNDKSTNGQFSTQQAYSGPEQSAEWVLERPLVCSSTSCQLSTLADYGQTTFDPGSVNGSSPHLTAADGGQMVDLSTGAPLSTPSNPDGDGDGFTTTYGSAQPTPPSSVSTPAVTSLSPTSGLTVGGQAVTINGSGFEPGASVTFGSTQALNVSFTSPSQLVAETPPGTAGAVSVTVTNPSGPSVTDSGAYTYQTPTGGGYSLDAFGGVHPFGDSPPVTVTGYWPNWDVARALALNPCDGATQISGWVMDAFGGLHPFADAGTPMPALPDTTAYWPGWAIANDFVAFCQTVGSVQHAEGCVLDGFGGLHPWADSSQVPMPPCAGSGYWPGWDIATKLSVIPGSDQGYVMDGFGGIHPFNGAPAHSPSGYWPGWAIARDVVATSNGGYTVDGFGGIHPFGSAPAISGTGYWPNWDVVRGIDMAWGRGGGAYTLDGFGGVHPAGGAPFLSVSGYWPGWAVVRDFITAP